MLLRRHPWIPASLAAGIYVVIAVCLALISAEPRFNTSPWISAALLVCGLGVLVADRWRPTWALAGAMLLAIVSLAVGTGAECLLVVIALYGVGARRSGPVAWVWFGAAMVCGALGAFVFTTRLSAGPSLWGSPPVTPRDSGVDWLVAYLVVAVALLITAVLGTNAGQRRRRVGALVERAEQLARERDQQAEIATARERERIAREMHDVIAHSLSVMIAIADGAHAAADERPGEAKIAIARVADTGRRTLAEVRRLLGSVRDEPEPADTARAPQPDASQLPALIEEFIAAGLPLTMSTTGHPTNDPAAGLTVYRIVQESLTNVLRHSRDVQAVTVTLEWTARGVSILVEDSAALVDGTLDRDAGRGILGMKERVAMFDGSVDTGPRANGGWRVSAQLQWEDE